MSDAIRMVPSGPPPPRPPEIFRSAQAAIGRVNDAIPTGDIQLPPDSSASSTETANPETTQAQRGSNFSTSRSALTAPQIALGLQPNPDPQRETGQNIDVRA